MLWLASELAGYEENTASGAPNKTGSLARASFDNPSKRYVTSVLRTL